MRYTRTVEDSNRIIFYGKVLFTLFFVSIIVQFLFFTTMFVNISAVADGHCYYYHSRVSGTHYGKAYNVEYYANNKLYKYKTACMPASSKTVIISYNKINPKIVFDEQFLFFYYVIILLVAIVCYYVGSEMKKNILEEQKSR